MKIYTDRDIDAFEKYFRIKFVNGITGFKSANLIGTKSDDGIENLAVFSSIVHIGSHPPYLGFVTRPITVPRNTYENILNTRYFTVNAISVGMAEHAHATSAKYPREISEFSKCNLSSDYINDFHAPFVKGSPLGIGCEFVEEIEIKSNATRMIIGKIKLVVTKDIDLHKDGYPKLSEAKIAAISSLDGYHQVMDPKRFEYARPDQPVEEIKM